MTELFTRGTTIITDAMPAIGALAAVGGTAVYALGKFSNQPGVVQWGKNGWIGAIVAFAYAGINTLLQAVGRGIGG